MVGVHISQRHRGETYEQAQVDIRGRTGDATATGGAARISDAEYSTRRRGNRRARWRPGAAPAVTRLSPDGLSARSETRVGEPLQRRGKGADAPSAQCLCYACSIIALT